MKIIFDGKKNEKLKKERSVSFEMVIDKMKRGEILLDFPNKSSYPNQRVMVVELNNYPYCVPYLQDDEKIVLKTVYPSRKMKRLLEKKRGIKNDGAED